MIALELDRLTASHVAVAIRRHRDTLTRTGRPYPESLREIEQMAAKVAKGDQSASDGDHGLAALAQLVQGESNGHSAPLAPSEAAVLLGVSVTTVRRQIARGELPTVTIGKRQRIPRHAIESRLVGKDEHD